MSTLLAIETSCDETAAAIVRSDETGIFALSNIISSQVKLHAPHGGVVPNLAAREHVRNIEHVLVQALREANLSVSDIDALAVTNAPGLIPALLVGTTTARTLAWLWKKPLLGIHHIEGHIYANFVRTGNGKRKMEKNTVSVIRYPLSVQWSFPLLALVVSGGHTQLILMPEHFHYEIVGETQDDAAGEAFDKVARILGLGYPGGPEVSRHAALARRGPIAESRLPAMPRPMLHSDNFHFSFSGLKTAVLYQTKRFRQESRLAETDPLPESFTNALCAEFENAATEVLVAKTIKAAKYFHARTVILAGGVSANKHLRERLEGTVSELDPPVTCHLSPVTLSMDNAAMIGAAAALRWDRMNEAEKAESRNAWQTLETSATAPLSPGTAHACNKPRHSKRERIAQ